MKLYVFYLSFFDQYIFFFHLTNSIPTCIFGKSWVAQRVWTILLFPEESHLLCWGLFVGDTRTNTCKVWQFIILQSVPLPLPRAKLDNVFKNMATRLTERRNMVVTISILCNPHYHIWTPRSWWCVLTWRRCTWSSAGDRQAWWWASGGICRMDSPKNTAQRSEIVSTAGHEPFGTPHMSKLLPHKILFEHNAEKAPWYLHFFLK